MSANLGSSGIRTVSNIRDWMKRCERWMSQMDNRVAALKLASGGGTGGPPTGAAGGDLTGTYPSPQIAPNAVSSAKIADDTITAADVNAAYKDGTAATPSLRTLGTGATQAAAGNHTHTPASIGAAPAAHTHTLDDIVAGGSLAPPLVMEEQAAPGAPVLGTGVFYIKPDGLPYYKGDDGIERPLITLEPALHANPDFEVWGTSASAALGTITFPNPGWDAYWTSGSVSYAPDAADVVSGNYSCRVTRGAGANARLLSSTAWTCQPGDVVTFTIYAKCSHASAGRLQVDLLTAADPTNPDFFTSGAVVQSRSMNLTNIWRRYEVSFVVPAGHNRGRFAVLPFASPDTGTNTFWLDNSSSTLRTPADAPVMTGSVSMWALAAAPAGYLICDGTVYNIADYPVLGALLGSTYGGNGTTTFGVPDLRDRAPVGSSGTKRIGTAGGAATRTLVAANLPSALVFRGSNQLGTGTGVVDRIAAGGTNNKNVQGATLGAADTPVDIQNPYRAVHFIIKT